MRTGRAVDCGRAAAEGGAGQCSHRSAAANYPLQEYEPRFPDHLNFQRKP